MKFYKFAAIVFFIFSLGTNVGMAQSSPMSGTGQEKVTPLMKQDLPDMTGHKALMLLVDFLPGQAAKPHRHPGSVFAYVLEGAIVSQLEGQPAITYHQGQYWYEPPQVGHIVCKNASETQPAKLLVWQLLEDDQSAVLPYQSLKVFSLTQ